MSRVRRSLVAAAATSLVVITSVAGLPRAEGDASPTSGPTAADGTGPTVHSSDGLAGPLLTSTSRHGRVTAARLDEVSWQVAPGLEYSQWTETAPQGPTRIFLLTAHLDEPGLVLDQVSGPTVSARGPLSGWLASDGAVAGVNADFFDIGDTGAPLGVGADRERHVLHAPASGWNTTFVLGRGYVPDVVQDRLVAQVTPDGGTPLAVSRFNSPTVPKGGIGVYTPSWGGAPGRHVLDGATSVRQVVIRDGVVRYNGSRLSDGRRFRGSVLLGSDAGARTLHTAFKVGQRATIRKTLSTPAHVAVSGSTRLLHDGQTTTTDNRELHPRTGLGLDRDQHVLHLVVVDGRSENSGGHTLLQLAQLLQSLGDDEGLNLDGGGSSTMVAQDPEGALAVRNQPSDGHERDVPNGLGFRYTPPAG